MLYWNSKIVKQNAKKNCDPLLVKHFQATSDSYVADKKGKRQIEIKLTVTYLSDSKSREDKPFSTSHLGSES